MKSLYGAGFFLANSEVGGWALERTYGWACARHWSTVLEMIYVHIIFM